MAKKVGRPVTKSGPAAARERKRARKAWQDLPASEKKKRVASRDKEAQRKADAKRLATQRGKRNEYHRKDAKATASVPKGKSCAVCGTTKNVQRHVVNGKFSRYLCAKHNNPANAKG